MEIKNCVSSALSSSVLTTIILVVILTLLWRGILVLWLRPKKIERQLRKQGLKGSVYKPFLGDAILLLKMLKDAWSSKPISLSDDTLPRVLPFIDHILRKYGKNSFAWAGTQPWLIVMDPDKIKDIFTRYEEFQKPNHPITKIIFVGLFGHEGEKWVKHRRIVNPAFHLDKLKTMVASMYVSCQMMTDSWTQALSKEGSVELDVAPYLENMTADVIARAAFGSSYDEGRKIFDLQREHMDLSMQLIQAYYIPGWRFLPTKSNRRLKSVNSEINELLTGIVGVKRAALEAAGERNENNLLGILLESSLKEIENHGDEKGRGMTIQEVVEECRLFYLAGAETISSLLTWTLILLSEHQGWQDKARTEIFQVFGKDEIPNYEGLNQLKVVGMILNEALRLYTPGYMLGRKVYKDTKLRDWFVPAGTQLIIPLSILHQDCDTWGNDAKEFNPERFAEGVSKAMKTPGIFMPFSGGPRVCLGQNFAISEGKMAVTMILQRFSLRLTPTYVHAPQAMISIKPQYGANLIISKIQ